MNEGSPFDHRPDPALGEALRDALSAPDHAGFVRRVMARLPAHVRRESGWDILGGWARRGVAVAATLLLVAGAWFAQMNPESPPPEAVLAFEVVDAGALLATHEPPALDVDLVLLGEQ
jgi:hypothetical protein